MAGTLTSTRRTDDSQPTVILVEKAKVYLPSEAEEAETRATKVKIEKRILADMSCKWAWWEQ
jgi:hypothetical protein